MHLNVEDLVLNKIISIVLPTYFLTKIFLNAFDFGSAENK